MFGGEGKLSIIGQEISLLDFCQSVLYVRRVRWYFVLKYFFLMQ